jgi:hypothetical protein
MIRFGKTCKILMEAVLVLSICAEAFKALYILDLSPAIILSQGDSGKDSWVYDFLYFQ